MKLGLYLFLFIWFFLFFSDTALFLFRYIYNEQKSRTFRAYFAKAVEKNIKSNKIDLNATKVVLIHQESSPAHKSVVNAIAAVLDFGLEGLVTLLTPLIWQPL